MHNEPRFSQKKVKKYIARFLQLNPNQLSWNFSHWQSKWHLNTFCVRQVDIFYTFGLRGNSNLAAEKSIFSNRFALFALKFLKSKPKKIQLGGNSKWFIGPSSMCGQNFKIIALMGFGTGNLEFIFLSLF